jgi:hypothetical protein
MASRETVSISATGASGTGMVSSSFDSFRAGPDAVRRLERDLAEAVDGEVRFDAGTGSGRRARARSSSPTGSAAARSSTSPTSASRDAMHLAELLATAGALDHAQPERAAAPRPASPSGAAKAAAAGGRRFGCRLGGAAALRALAHRGGRH